METVLSSEVMQDFDAVMSQHRPRIFRFILASLRDRESAENLTQECFVRAYRARDQFRGAASIPTWLLQIAANLIRDHESSGRLKFWRRALGIDLRDVMDVIPDRQLSPESMLSVKQEVAAIWRVAAKLSERQRTVLLLRFVEDLDLLEIAEVTGLKLGTVKTHLFRALEAVRKALEERQ
jgi:RNA polymerase sigma-70 factor (ECF subfamily)